MYKLTWQNFLQDPSTQLEQLRRNSLIAPGDLNLPERKQKTIPDRGMPASSTSIPEEAVLDVGQGAISLEAATSAPVKESAAAPTFGAMNFGSDGASGVRGGESVVSPSEEVAP